MDGLPYSKIRTDDGDWVPCDSSKSVSHCCSSKDYCLDNGLCLDAGANNYFSIQGCTDPSWPAGSPCVTSPQCKKNLRKSFPVHRSCAVTKTCALEDEYSFAFPCRMATNSSFYYCCGQTADCCTNATEPDLLVFAGVTDINRPTVLPDGTSSGQATATPDSGAQADSTRNLAIGAGVGGGVGLAVIAALVFFGCQMRKARKAERRRSSVPTLSGPEKSVSSPLSATAHVENYLQAQQQFQHQQQSPYLPGQGQGSPFQAQFPSNPSTPAQAFSYSTQPPAGSSVYQMPQGATYPPQVAGHGEIHELR